MSDFITSHRFTGKREWGLVAPDDAPCQHFSFDRQKRCGRPKAAHKVVCSGVLMVAGESYRCDWPTDANGEHKGWAHSNKEAKALWADTPNDRANDERFREARGYYNAVDVPLQTDIRQPLREFLIWIAGNGGTVVMGGESGLGYKTFAEIADAYATLKESGTG